VHDQIKQQDQTYAILPGLVAHPNTVMQMPDYRLDQINNQDFGNFVNLGYLAKQDFLESNLKESHLLPIFK